jgi:Amt family ammonium transporter
MSAFTTRARRVAPITVAGAVGALLPLAALAADDKPKIDSGDTAWMIVATTLVLLMSLPGLALFYAGMVRKKNALATTAQTLATVALLSVLWVVVGYSLAFTAGNAVIGDLSRFLMMGLQMDGVHDAAKTIPENVFMMFQLTFAVITPAIVVGAAADRMKFSAMLWFMALWLLVVYCPIAHWVWGGGFLQKAGVLDFAGGIVVHINAGVAGLVLAIVLKPRRGYPTENMAPHNLVLTVIGVSLLWVGWFGFNGGSAVAADSRAGMAITVTHISAATAALAWMFAEWATRG